MDYLPHLFVGACLAFAIWCLSNPTAHKARRRRTRTTPVLRARYINGILRKD